MTITTPNNLVAKLAAKLKGTIDTPSEQYSILFLLSGVLILLLRYEIEIIINYVSLYNDFKSGLFCVWEYLSKVRENKVKFLSPFIFSTIYFILNK